VRKEVEVRVRKLLEEGHQPRPVEASRSWKRQGKGAPLKYPEGMQAC